MAALLWIVFSVVELTLFILVLRKAKSDFCYRVKNFSKTRDKTQDITTVIARDSISYFAM